METTSEGSGSDEMSVAEPERLTFVVAVTAVVIATGLLRNPVTYASFNYTMNDVYE